MAATGASTRRTLPCASASPWGSRLSPADWDAAEQCFDACRNLVAADGPSTVYLERIAPSAAPPPAAGDAVWHISAK